MDIRALTSADHDAWLALWRGYLDFYGSQVPDLVTETTFERLVSGDGMHGALAVDDDGTPVGLVHWLTHPATWSLTGYCYLEDLFVAPDVRGTGAGRALVAHVTDWARAEGCAKVYWLTQEGNATARALYDRVATASGFVHYQIGLD